ncbi:hypothetical protein CK203_106010 [Vitis vinifera]|uniref:Uncharacterized protein n=1 Tax=Vitis vinifera TaxID=29760 RepID=A0A438DFD8_VITVI|nr:hypothetical protein CK203_106010 [Vitis vinifera]
MLHMATPTIQIGNHPNFSWKPRAPQYTQPGQAPSQASNLEQAIVNLSKNPKGIHEVEAQERESSQVREVKAVITLRVEDMMKKHMPPPFPKLCMAKRESIMHQILEVLRQVKVNIPLLDMIKQVPTYAKFLKDLCTIKRGLNVNKKAFLTEQEWSHATTFGNMTLELNIFYLCKKQFHPEKEEGPEERREEILPLFNGEETQEAINEEPPKLILKPLPIELKYAYLEENKQSLVVISSSLTTIVDPHPIHGPARLAILKSKRESNCVFGFWKIHP